MYTYALINSATREVEGLYKTPDGVPVALGQEVMEVEPIAGFPVNTGGFILKEVNGVVVLVDTLTLAQRKELKRQSITLAKEEADSSYFVFNGKHISADYNSIKQITALSSYVSLFNAFPSTFPNAWKAIDNTYVQITTIAIWKDFVQAMVDTGISNFIKSQTLKAAVDACSTVEELDEVSW